MEIKQLTFQEGIEVTTTIEDPFDPSTGHTHDGTDSKKIRLSVVNNSSTPITVGDNTDFVDNDTTSGDLTNNLPSSPESGQKIVISNSGANNVIIGGNGNNINGAASLTLTTIYMARTLVFNGTEWRVIS